MKIKFIHEMSTPMIRARDGELMTHCLRLTLTTDEALELSQLFEQWRNGENKPSVSLIRTALLEIAEKSIDEGKLLQAMARMRTRAELASKLSRTECDKALSYISNPPPKIKVSAVDQAKKERRVYIPDPPRRR